MSPMKENQRFLTATITTTGVIAWAVVLLIDGIILPGDFPQALRDMGIATIAAAIVSFLIKSVLWKYFPLRNILKIPDLSGRWEGWTYSYLAKEWRKSAHIYGQQALDISALAIGGPRAQGICASLLWDPPGQDYKLVWSYDAERYKESGSIGDKHTGTHFLRYSSDPETDKKYLNGFYVNNRMRDNDKTRGATGYVTLVWVSRSTKSLLENEGGGWGMERPTSAP